MRKLELTYFTSWLASGERGITLLCELCDRPFHARAVVAVCPPCSATAHIEIAGEMSGC